MSSPQPAPPPDQSSAAQVGLGVALAAALAALWPSLNLADLRNALPAFTAAVSLQVQRHAQASAALAVRQYAAQRSAAGVAGAFTPRPADPPPLAQIAQAVDWAVQPLWSADVLASPATVVGDVGAGASEALATAQTRLEGATQKLVTDTGRRTAIQSAAADPKASGYYREPQGTHPCYFCAMLATRGPVYKEHSYDRANAEFLGDGRAKTHDHCDCEMKPYFGPHHSWEPTGKVAEWDRKYASATAGVYGSKNAQLAFRRDWEGRTAPKK